MAEPKTKYEYGSTPEQEQGGIWPLLSQLGGLFTPERREVITPSKTTYTDIDGVYFPNTTPGVYGPVERGIENMPVVQGAKSAYEFLGDLISSGKKRGETADALVKGIGTLIEDQKRAGINAAMTGQTSFYDPEEKREVSYDPLLTPATMGAAGKGSGRCFGHVCRAQRRHCGSGCAKSSPEDGDKGPFSRRNLGSDGLVPVQRPRRQAYGRVEV